MYLREALMASTMVHIRIDEKTKQKAAKTLAAMGLSVSDAVRMLLLRVAAEKALPFDVKVPKIHDCQSDARRSARRGKASEVRKHVVQRSANLIKCEAR
jgi:DNA-damage-inducible protein J